VIVPFNRPHLTGNEFKYIQDATERGALAGRGYYTQKCTEWLENSLSIKKVFLTHSCTAALEICALLLDLAPGDEIIMPSFTFVSSANAFALRGAVPVFVDICNDTLNIDPSLIEEAITPKTRAVLAVHYAGVACDMITMKALCKKYNLILIEDAAQAILSKDENSRYLGSIGDLAAFSFHETKNIISGEGGALLINNESFQDRAAILLEKGTDRIRFQEGLTSKYTWQDLGSSFIPGEIIAAFLFAQLESAQELTSIRTKLWNNYYSNLQLSSPVKSDQISLPSLASFNCTHNSHIFHLRTQDSLSRDQLLLRLKDKGIQAVFHYIPLHSSPAGKRFGRFYGNLPVTDAVSSTLLRLPMWIGVNQGRVLEIVNETLDELY